MSGIFGIVKFNNEPVYKDELLNMQRAVIYNTSSSNNIIIDHSVGFGHMRINSAPEGHSEKLPAISPCKNYLFTAYARLDYRDELCKKLGVTGSDINKITDTALVLKAFLKWESECVHNLYGDWIFAVYNKRTKKLFLAKDHTGNTGLYYSRYNDYFCFSTSLKSIMAFDWVDRSLDETTILALLTYGGRYKPDQTVYKNIFNIKAASCLTVCKNSENQQRRFWNITDVKSVKYKKEEDYIEHFLSIYSEAIRSSVRTDQGEIGISLSSGLDSSSVASFAAPYLKESGKVLHAFTSIPLFKDKIPDSTPFQADESNWVQQIANYIGNIETSFVRADQYAPLGSVIHGIDEMGHMIKISINSYWLQGIAEEAQKKGVKRMLTGQNGNLTISWNGEGLILYSLLQGKLFKSYKEINDWKRRNQMRNSDVLRKLVASPLKQHVISSFKKTLLSQKDLIFKNTIVNKQIIKEIDIRNALKDIDFIPDYTIEINPERKRQRLFNSQITDLGLMYNELRLAYGIEYVDPTQDRRLIEFTFGIPSSLWLTKGTDRYLIRKAMKGKIPEEIIENKTRIPQSADVGLRLATDTGFEAMTSAIGSDKKIKRYIESEKLLYHIKEIQTDKSILKKRLNAQCFLNAAGVYWFLSKTHR